MDLRHDELLIVRAASLATGRPEDWKEFIAAFRSYAESIREECIKSPLERLPWAQGRAQVATKIFELISDAVPSADRIVQRRASKS